MDQPLSAVAVRILGALVEKELTTPDQYPLTLNALTTACNQTSNREPVMQLDPAEVMSGLDELTKQSLARGVHRSDSRVLRYKHLLSETLNLHPAEIATMCVLMLRGPQTVGEIRTRTTRLFEFIDLAHVEITLQALITLSDPLVAQLPRQPGQKEVRYAHLLSGEPEVAVYEASEAGSGGGAGAGAGAGAAAAGGLRDRVEALEAEVAALRADLGDVREQLAEFRRQFE